MMNTIGLKPKDFFFLSVIVVATITFFSFSMYKIFFHKNVPVFSCENKCGNDVGLVGNNINISNIEVGDSYEINVDSSKAEFYNQKKSIKFCDVRCKVLQKGLLVGSFSADSGFYGLKQKKLLMQGNVELITDKHRIKAEKVEIFAQQKKVVLTGGVVCNFQW
jgi:hypothetical protein